MVGTLALVLGCLALLAFLFQEIGLAVLICLVASPFWLTLALRSFRSAHSRLLWSLRNRLVFVYGLFGVLPLLLVVTLVGLGAWALMNELAIYLASSALDRQLEVLGFAVDALHRQPANQREIAGPDLAKAFGRIFPGILLLATDSAGTHHFPSNASAIIIPRGWKAAHGLLVIDGRFYGWHHSVDHDGEITAIAPLSDHLIQNLVPHLGNISIVEVEDKNSGATAGALNSSRTGADLDFLSTGKSENAFTLPPSISRFDIPVFIPSTQVHSHLNSPNASFKGILWVYSRPSAVLRTFFSGSEDVREVLIYSILGIAVLFLLVELVAISIGVSLSRRITNAVHQLYEGTRRVIKGDFSHRILVRDNDQLGELAQSFNQMTGNLERLLVVEKEKERLQTEVEIAREVQGQLYPKAAPPTCGLKLTVRCDPARMVSGDYYDYVQVASGKLVFAIGDVAGKGISAALLMATLQAALRAQVTSYTPLREIDCADEPEVHASALVSKLNKQIYAHTSPEKYATFFFAIFNEVDCSLTYTNAGHLSPLLFRKDSVTPLDSNGTVVGAFPFAKYDESCLSMQPGDLLVCYTDGITEPENAYGEMFGEERMIALIQKNQHLEDSLILDSVLDAVRAWTGLPELHDDMTILLARQVGAPA